MQGGLGKEWSNQNVWGGEGNTKQYSFRNKGGIRGRTRRTKINANIQVCFGFSSFGVSETSVRERANVKVSYQARNASVISLKINFSLYYAQYYMFAVISIHVTITQNLNSNAVRTSLIHSQICRYGDT